MNIHSLIEAIGKSVSKAQQGIEQHSISRFFDYFQKPDPVMTTDSYDTGDTNDTDNTDNVPQGLEPITAKVIMPCSDNIGKTAPVEIPLVALAHHRQVHLNKVNYKHPIIKSMLKLYIGCSDANRRADAIDCLNGLYGEVRQNKSAAMSYIEKSYNVLNP